MTDPMLAADAEPGGTELARVMGPKLLLLFTATRHTIDMAAAVR